jgi:hypothetical protein
MANLIEIPSFQNKYSENLFSSTALMSEATDVNFTGSHTSAFYFNSYKNFSYKGKSLDIVANSSLNNPISIEFDLVDALLVTAKNTGLHIFSFGILFESLTLPDNNQNVTLEVDVYVNSILSETFTKGLSPLNYETNRYYNFAQSFNLAELDEVNFIFKISYPAITGFASAFRVNFDAFQLVFDKINTGYGLPSSYTTPLGNQQLGIYDYANTLTSQSFTGTAIKLNNNGAGANTNLDYKFNAIPAIYNTTTNFLKFDSLQLGDKVDVRTDITVTTTTANQDVDIYLDVALGTATNYQIYLCRRNFKTAGTYVINDVSNWLYIGNTDTRDYNCAVMFDSDANATVLNNGVAISVTKRVV